MFILILLTWAQCGRIRPYGARSLTMSSVNSNSWSEYNFTMTLETTLPSTGILIIEFPQQNYPDRLGLRPDAILYAPYPTQRTYTQDDRSLEIVLGEWPIDEPLTVTIDGIINPQKSGGTGNFKIYTMIGQNIVDINRNFAVVGLTDSTIDLLSASITISNNYAGQVTDYVCTMQPSEDLDQNVDFLITFPELYDISYLTDCTSNLFDASCTVNNDFLNQVLVSGNDNTISKGTNIILTFQDITNPSRRMKTPLFEFRIMERDTNNTLQQSLAVNGLDIAAGTMSLVALNILYYQPYIYYLRDFTLQFRPTNTFQYARISTDFYQIIDCYITSGLLDLTSYDDSLCVPLGKLMYLSNFQSYVASDYSYDYIEVTFTARIGDKAILTNPVQIYTYIDSDYLYLADEDTLTTDSQIQLLSMPIKTSTLTYSITYDSASLPVTNSPITIVYIAKVGIALSTKTTFGLEIPNSFQGVPSCTYKNPSNVYVDVNCEFSLGFVNLTTTFTSYDSSVNGATITITGLYTPIVAGSYPIGVFVQDQYNVYYNNGTFVISAPQFKTAKTQVSSISNNAGTQTAIQFQLQLDTDVSAGVKNMDDPYVAFTTFEIYFYQYYISSNIFDYDLGSGYDDFSDYPCQFQSGFVASSNQNLSCILIHGTNTASPTSSDYAMIKVQGYAAITASTSPVVVIFKIPVKYPTTISAIPKIVVNLVYYNEKIKSLLRSQSFNIGAVKSQSGNALTTFSGPQLDNSKLQVTTTLTYKFKTTISIAKSTLNGIYYEIPDGFTFNSSKVLVSIDGTYQDSSVIQYFPTFLFIMTSSSVLSNGVTHSLVFEQVDIPISLPSSSITHVIKTATGGQFADTVSFTFSTLTKGSLLDLSTSISSNLQQHPYVNYSIAFTLSLQTYTGSYIVIDFPIGFDLQASAAYLENIPYTNLQNTTTNKISYNVPSSTKMIITNFLPLIKGQRISLALYSIQNPTSGTYSITISTTDSNFNKIEDGTVSVTIGTSTFNTQILPITSVISLPNNQNVQALYIWNIVGSFQIPKFSEIRLFLTGMTSIYSISADVVSCRIVQNAVIALRDCQAVETATPPYISMILDYPISASTFQIEYYGYLSLGADLSGLSIQILYNSITIASGTCPTVTTASSITSSDVTLSFYPKNEGEIAYYIFTIPCESIDILSTYYILIRFPFEYDYIVGLENIQATSSVLQGALKISVFPYHLEITGFYDLLDYTGNLDITLLGIINPNRINNEETGTFLFAIMNSNTMILGNDQISGIIPQLAPGLIQLNSITSSVVLSRYSSIFTFNFYPLQKVPATVYGGELYIDFPDNFIIDSFSGTCETTSSFSYFSSCLWDYFRFTFVTNNQDWYSDRSGALELTISTVLTPDDEGETNNFIIYNYDSINKIVLGRTYANLHSASQTYSYDGLQIDVNYKQPYNLEVGSYSDEIIMNVTTAVESTLTLSPNVLDSTIIITPNPVQIEAGSTQATFRVAAPRTILLKTYYIQWSKTGDTSPVTYAPLRLTPLQMVKGTLKRTLTVEQLEYMPKNGTSYPIYITTNNPPYQQLLIRIGFKMNTTADVPLRQKWLITDKRLSQLGLTYDEVVESGIDVTTHSMANLSDTQLTMGKLQYSVNYTLNVSVYFPNSTLSIYYRLKGYDADSFNLDIQQMDIPIRSEEYRKPKILEATALKITRSTATFQIFTDIKGFVFYVFADQHMPSPTFEGTQTPNLSNTTLTYSNPIYGVAYVRTTTLDVNFTISDLSPLHDYEIFLFPMNLNTVNNPSFTKVYFQTEKSQSIALMTLKINQATIDSEVKLDYIQKMAEMISIDKSYIQERTTSCKQTILDTSTSTSYIYWNLMILPDPTNMNEYTKPLVLAQTLNTRRTEIQSFITRLDDEPFYTLEEIADEIPSFVISPYMIDRTTESISVRFTVSYCGNAYLIIRERENSSSLSLVNETLFASELTTTQFPSSYQIKMGLNESNQPINQTSLTIEDTTGVYQYNYTDLNQKTVYDVFISLENDFNSNALLFDNTSVARFSAKTQKIIVALNIYSINNSFILLVILSLWLQIIF